MGTTLVYTTPSVTALTMDKARMVIMTNPNVPQGQPAGIGSRSRSRSG
jgi:hypothetical protein